MSQRRVQASALLAVALCAMPWPARAQEDTWEGLKPLPTPRRLLAAAAAGGRIYTFGGCGSPCFQPPFHTSTDEETLVEVYDPHAGWSQGTRIPAILFGAAAASPGDGKLYTFGGFITGNVVLRYDPTAVPSAAWHEQARMPTPRHGLAAAVLDGRVYVVGGNGPTGALEIYDPGTDTWETGLPPLPTPRVFLAAAALRGKLYTIGGSPDCCGESRSDVVEVYDPAAKRWRQAPRLPVALQGAAAAAIGGKLYVFGGLVPGEGVLGRTFEFDPLDGPNGTWQERPVAMPTPRDQMAAVVLRDPDNGREFVHLLGGAVDCHCRALGSHERYRRGGGEEMTDLTITKDDGRREVEPGQWVVYTIHVGNAGPTSVAGAMVYDILPSELEADYTWSCTASEGARCTAPAAGTPLDHPIDLPVGGAVTFTLTATVRSTATGSISNTVRVDPPLGVEDPNEDNNEETDTDTVASCLSLSKTDGRATVAPGDAPVFRVTVSNTCPVAIAATVTDDLAAAGLVAPAAACCGDGCTPAPLAGALAAPVSVPADGSLSCTVIGTVRCGCGGPSVITNRACVSRPGVPEQCASDSEPDAIVRPSRVSVALAGPATVTAGEEFSYELMVTIREHCPAEGVVLDFQPPVGFERVPGPGPCPGFPCVLGRLPPGSLIVPVRYRVPPDHPCPRDAGAHATVASTCDGAGSDDHTLRIECPYDLCITKSDGLATAAPGDTLRYTIAVTNPGVRAATGAAVRDDFPPELTQVRWCLGAQCVPNRGSHLFETLDLPPGGSATYRVQGIVASTFKGALANTATVTPPGGAPDLRPENNTATDIDEIGPRPCMSGLCDVEGWPVEGGTITYVFVLWKGIPRAQPDNPGFEFFDVLPDGLTLAGATADSGSLSVLPASVGWNGAIPLGGRVIVRITATIQPGTAGRTICNRARLAFDADGDGVNESSRETDDPRLPGANDPCCFTVVPAVIEVPALSPWSVAALCLLLVLSALVRLRRAPAR